MAESNKIRIYGPPHSFNFVKVQLAETPTQMAYETIEGLIITYLKKSTGKRVTVIQFSRSTKVYRTQAFPTFLQPPCVGLSSGLLPPKKSIWTLCKASSHNKDWRRKYFYSEKGVEWGENFPRNNTPSSRFLLPQVTGQQWPMCPSSRNHWGKGKGPSWLTNQQSPWGLKESSRSCVIMGPNIWIKPRAY